MQKFNSFADLANARMELADTRSDVTAAYDGAFLEQSDMAKLSVVEEPMAAEMPDPDMARAAVELAIGTVFDVLKDTRMEEFAQHYGQGAPSLGPACSACNYCLCHCNFSYFR